MRLNVLFVFDSRNPQVDAVHSYVSLDENGFQVVNSNRASIWHMLMINTHNLITIWLYAHFVY